MKGSIRTSPRVGDVPRRRRKKEPDRETLLRISYLEWLVEEFGADTVAEWQDPPVTFQEWKRERELSAHEAA
ncbi:MAG: hypothetical protein L6Q95_02535 [Planctomycetes bacterium]|nr:hypothetical protein [Planctomycetota bacterium]